MQVAQSKASEWKLQCAKRSIQGIHKFPLLLRHFTMAETTGTQDTQEGAHEGDEGGGTAAVWPKHLTNGQRNVLCKLFQHWIPFDVLAFCQLG